MCEIGNETPVGHLSMEISRTTKFLIDRGATVTAELTSDHYRRSPLIQGGIEIPCSDRKDLRNSYKLTHNGEVQTACTGAIYGNERRGNFGLLLACRSMDYLKRWTGKQYIRTLLKLNPMVILLLTSII